MASSSSSIPTQIAETIQTASLQRNPSPRHDLNPSTAASEMEPVRLVEEDREKKQQQRKQRRRELRKKRGEKRRRHESSIDGIDDDSLSDDDEDYGDDDFGDGDSSEEDDDDDDEIPISVLRPRPRERSSYPPMPDLRFEQSYLHSLAKADTWWKVAWVTVRDQIMMPFAQGVLYNLAICGWHHWNRHAQLGGNSAGARLRRWWYSVNNWPLVSGNVSSRPRRKPYFG